MRFFAFIFYFSFLSAVSLQYKVPLACSVASYFAFQEFLFPINRYKKSSFFSLENIIKGSAFIFSFIACKNSFKENILFKNRSQKKTGPLIEKKDIALFCGFIFLIHQAWKLYNILNNYWGLKKDLSIIDSKLKKISQLVEKDEQKDISVELSQLKEIIDGSLLKALDAVVLLESMKSVINKKLSTFRDKISEITEKKELLGESRDILKSQSALLASNKLLFSSIKDLNLNYFSKSNQVLINRYKEDIELLNAYIESIQKKDWFSGKNKIKHLENQVFFNAFFKEMEDGINLFFLDFSKWKDSKKHNFEKEAEKAILDYFKIVQEKGKELSNIFKNKTDSILYSQLNLKNSTLSSQQISLEKKKREQLYNELIEEENNYIEDLFDDSIQLDNMSSTLLNNKWRSLYLLVQPFVELFYGEREATEVKFEIESKLLEVIQKPYLESCLHYFESLYYLLNKINVFVRQDFSTVTMLDTKSYQIREIDRAMIFIRLILSELDHLHYKNDELIMQLRNLAVCFEKLKQDKNNVN